MATDPLPGLAEAVRLLEEDGHSAVIIGAFAREVTFDRLLGRHSHRATRDIDAAVRISDWTHFERVATILTRGGRFRRAPSEELKFIHVSGLLLGLDVRATVGASHAARLDTIVRDRILTDPDYLALGRVVGSERLHDTIQRFEVFRDDV